MSRSRDILTWLECNPFADYKPVPRRPVPSFACLTSRSHTDATVFQGHQRRRDGPLCSVISPLIFNVDVSVMLHKMKRTPDTSSATALEPPNELQKAKFLNLKVRDNIAAIL